MRRGDERKGRADEGTGHVTLGTPDADLNGVQEVLLEHFPNATEQQRNECAFSIYDGFRTASAMQKIERGNVSPQKDIADLRTAVRHLRKAEAALCKIGWHAGVALRPVAEKALAEGRGRRLMPIVGATDAPEIIRQQLTALAAELTDAFGRIDPTSEPVFDYLDEGFRTGRAAETAAYFTARECAAAFRELSGKRARRRTHWATGRSYGPFLNMVRAVFAALGIKASVEHAARRAMAMEENPQK